MVALSTPYMNAVKKSSFLVLLLQIVTIGIVSAQNASNEHKNRQLKTNKILHLRSLKLLLLTIFSHKSVLIGTLRFKNDLTM